MGDYSLLISQRRKGAEDAEEEKLGVNFSPNSANLGFLRLFWRKMRFFANILLQILLTFQPKMGYN